MARPFSVGDRVQIEAGVVVQREYRQKGGYLYKVSLRDGKDYAWVEEESLTAAPSKGNEALGREMAASVVGRAVLLGHLENHAKALAEQVAKLARQAEAQDRANKRQDETITALTTRLGQVERGWTAVLQGLTSAETRLNTIEEMQQIAQACHQGAMTRLAMLEKRIADEHSAQQTQVQQAQSRGHLAEGLAQRIERVEGTAVQASAVGYEATQKVAALGKRIDRLRDSLKELEQQVEAIGIPMDESEDY